MAEGRDGGPIDDVGPASRSGRGWTWWAVELGVIGWYLVLTVVYLWPLLTGLAQVAVHSIRDPGLQATVVNNVTQHLLAGDLAHLFDGSFFYPAHLTLALSDIQIGLQPVALPLRLVDDDALFIHNLLSVATFPLTALAADRLARVVGGGSRIAGWVSGTVYAFAAYRMEHLIHLAMLASWVVPLAFLGLELTLRERRWRGPVIWAFSLIAAASLALHYLLILAVAQPLYLAARLLLSAERRDLLSRLTRLVVPAVVAALAVGVLIVPYALLAGQGFTRSIGEAYQYSARPLDYLLPSSDSVVAHPLADALRPVTGVDERHLSPGLIAIVLALAGIAAALALRRRRWLIAIAPWLAIALVAFVLSLGPRLLPNAQVPANGGGNLPLPYLVLAKVVPLFASLRAPARFGVIVLLVVGVVAGWALAAAVRRLDGHRIVAGGLVVTVGVLMALEYSVAPGVAAIAWGPTLPGSVRWLEAAPPGPVVEYPTLPVDASTYALHSTVDGHPRLNGWSGFTPKISRAINAPVIPPDGFPAWLAEARQLGARYFVLHEATLDPAVSRAMEAAAAQGGLRLAATFDVDRVYVFGS